MIQMNEDRAFAGDMRYNPTTHTMEIYDGKRWTLPARTSFEKVTGQKDVRVWIDETIKKKALDELFGEK